MIDRYTIVRITLSSLLVICTALTMQPTVMLRVVLLFPSWEEKMHWVLAGFPPLRAFTMMSKHSKGSAFSSKNGTLTTFIPLILSAARPESMVLKPLTTPSTLTTSVISSLSRGFSLSSLSRKISIVPPSSIDLSSTCLTNSSFLKQTSITMNVSWNALVHLELVHLLDLAPDVEIAVGVGLIPGCHWLAVDIGHGLLAGVEPNQTVIGDFLNNL